MKKIRSILYVPGANTRALARASSTGADGWIFDLEDAVAPDMKGQARLLVAERLAKQEGSSFVVRINGLDTPWAGEDLAMVNMARPAAVLVPKLESAGDLAKVKALLGEGIAIWGMLETPRGILAVETIAEALAERAPMGSEPSCLVMGLNDLSQSTQARQTPGRAPMLAWMSRCILAARAHGVGIIDGVFNDLRDPQGLRAECLQARDLGFDGKTLIHPDQVEVANTAFLPSEQETAHARAIVEAFEAPGSGQVGAIAVNGQMVERLHLLQAQRVLALSVA